MSKILIIEDDDISCEIISNILMPEGYELITADNGVSGLEIAKKEIPDLIISDIMMPEMDGYAVLSSLKNDPRTAVIPFVFLTAKGNKDDIREGMGLGASDYLTKPFHSSEILQVVQVQIEKYKKITRFMDELSNNLVSSLPQEFYTPLNSILGFSSLLQEAIHNKYDMPVDQLSGYISFIHESGKRLLRLAQNYVMYTNLLVFSNDNIGKHVLQNKIVQNTSWVISRTAEETVRNYNRLGDLHCDIQECTLKISPEYLERIISEVIENIIVYSPIGKKILIEGKPANSLYTISLTFKSCTSREPIQDIQAFMEYKDIKDKQNSIGVGLALTRQIIFIYEGKFSISGNENKDIVVSIQLSHENERI
ncbi:MAG: hybrid sensor histidine kinase/response regulator [Leptospiraceae bacterium]|nr:hybrid sensor histidine kinase/response regulator [Leptospiraceae bacterium]